MRSHRLPFARHTFSSSRQRSACCLHLSQIALHRTFPRVENAEWSTATQLAVGATSAPIEAPEHCLFRVMIDARPSGIDGMSYGTGIELRLPANWNGRLLFQGGGGLNGVLLPAVGAVGGFPLR